MTGIDHHVAGTGIECQTPVRRSLPPAIAVRLAIPPMFCTMRPIRLIAIKQIIEKGNQRRALAAGSHVGRTEIRNHRNSNSRGDDRAFARLPGDRDLVPEKRCGLPW